HLTRLNDFRAVKDANCRVELAYGSSPAEVFPCDPSTHPGIFGANVEPSMAGEPQLTISVSGRDLTTEDDVRPVKGAGNKASAAKPVPPTEETLNFTKEQQWALDFGTEVAGQQSLRENLRVAGETQARTGGEANVIVPVAGRLIVDKTFPVGTTVTQGTEMA